MKQTFVVERVYIFQRRVRYQVEAGSAILARHKVDSNLNYPELDDDGYELIAEFNGPTRLDATRSEVAP